MDLKKATKIALGMETANKESVNLGGTREIHGVDQMRKREACFRCGDVKHRAPDCVFKDRECLFVEKRDISQRYAAKGRRRSKIIPSTKLNRGWATLS